MVRYLKGQGMVIVIFIIYDLNEVVKVDRIIVMNGGKKYVEGLFEEIFKLNKEFV